MISRYYYANIKKKLQMKKDYQKPSTNMFSIKMENHLLGVSNVTTTDPTDGGDPTGSNGSSENPFKPSGAKAGQFDDDEEEDFKAWE